LGRDNSPLSGIVVDKHETVDTKVEFFGDDQDVVRLWFPIRLEAGEVLELQH